MCFFPLDFFTLNTTCLYSFSLHFNSAFLVYLPQSPIHTGIGRYVELMCRVHGRPPPRVTWLKSGRPLTSSHFVSSHDGQHRYTLSINQVKEDDFGEYTCMAESELGSTNSSIRLTGKTQVTGDSALPVITFSHVPSSFLPSFLIIFPFTPVILPSPTFSRLVINSKVITGVGLKT